MTAISRNPIINLEDINQIVNNSWLKHLLRIRYTILCIPYHIHIVRLIKKHQVIDSDANRILHDLPPQDQRPLDHIFDLNHSPFQRISRRWHKSTEFQPTFHYLFPPSKRPYRGQHWDHDVNITRAREQAFLFSTKIKVFCPSCISEDKWLPLAIFFKVEIRRSKTLKIKIKTLEDMTEPVKGILKIYFLSDRFRKRLFLIQDFVDNK